jgi:hypothetical protein
MVLVSKVESSVTSTILGVTSRSIHQGGVALVWKDSHCHVIESIRHHGSDVLSFELVTGSRRWLVIGAYISPNRDGQDECNHILHARNQRQRLPVIITGDLNVNLDNDTQLNERGQRIKNCMSLLGVEDMSNHFRRRQSFFDGTTWKQYREGHWIRSKWDYVLSDDYGRKNFRQVRLADPRRYDSDHLAVCFTLNASPPKAHKQYLSGRRSFPLTPDRGRLTEAPNSWKLIDQRATLRRRGIPADGPTGSQIAYDQSRRGDRTTTSTQRHPRCLGSSQTVVQGNIRSERQTFAARHEYYHYFLPQPLHKGRNHQQQPYTYPLCINPNE